MDKMCKEVQISGSERENTCRHQWYVSDQQEFGKYLNSDSSVSQGK